MTISSEIGRLREVILHRPGLELRRLTPANKDTLLFDELVWVGKAQQEHDLLRTALEREQDRQVGVDLCRQASRAHPGMATAACHGSLRWPTHRGLPHRSPVRAV